MTEERRPTAVVTGGSSGIGLAVAEALVQQGHEVVITARNPERLREAAERIGARWYAVDAVDESGMAAVFAELGHVDLLVHSAGVFRAKGIRKQTAAEFSDTVGLNLTSAYVASRAAVQTMRPGGRIIIIGSISGIDGHPWLTGYAASKAGVRMLAESMRAEVEKDGISVNVLILPTVDTPMMVDIERPAILVEDCVSAVLWLDSLHPRVRVPELVLRSADDSPFGHRINVRVEESATEHVEGASA
ncbi:SDR family oxidoreductase [Rhodococcus sp. 14C212]|uniref:SDR family oxidoreductase n=1 Tax=Rhodococcus sp. 14C212 TaxID=2711209 RepID=UPI0013ED8751|nr:SDR family oxidoreductase [Rhodococcus sp. 14C212]NGP07397.1 SDR family oxidoreductase [Rhodococcus sp. 14C212]